MLFRAPRRELSEEEASALLECILQSTGGLLGSDLFLATLSVQHIVSGLRAAGVMLVRNTEKGRML